MCLPIANSISYVAYDCGNPGCEIDVEKEWDLVDGSYCSYACSYRHQGKKLLSDIEHSHTRCASCGVQLKEVQKPSETHPDVFIGYQYRTKFADWGEKTVFIDNKEFDTTGTICKNCGATDHRDDYLREFHYTDFVKRVLRYLREKYKTGGLDKPVNERVFLDCLKDGFSLEYSLGKAFEGKG